MQNRPTMNIGILDLDCFVIDSVNDQKDKHLTDLLLAKQVLEWATSKGFAKVYFCTSRFGAAHKDFISGYITGMRNKGKNPEGALTTVAVDNFLREAKLEDKFVAVSMPEDKTLGLGQTFLKKFKPVELQWQQSIRAGADALTDMVDDEMFAGSKNRQIQQIIQDACTANPDADLHFHYGDDCPDLCAYASYLSVPKGCRLSVYHWNALNNDAKVVKVVPRTAYGSLHPDKVETLVTGSVEWYENQINRIAQEKFNGLKLANLPDFSSRAGGLLQNCAMQLPDEMLKQHITVRPVTLKKVVREKWCCLFGVNRTINTTAHELSFDTDGFIKDFASKAKVDINQLRPTAP